MIAQLLPGRDICIFLAPDEIPSLPKKSLEGALIRYDEPTIRGTLQLNIDEEGVKMNGGHSGIGVDFSTNPIRAEVFIGDLVYQKLVQQGSYECRYGVGGSKARVVNRSNLSAMELIRVEGLEFYRDNP